MDTDSNTTIIILPNHNKKETKHGVDLVINQKRMAENERHRFSLREGK